MQKKGNNLKPIAKAVLTNSDEDRKVDIWPFGLSESGANAKSHCFPKYMCFLENVSFLCVTVQVFRAHCSS